MKTSTPSAHFWQKPGWKPAARAQRFVRKLAQKRAHDRHSALLVGHAAQRLKLLRGHLRQRLRHEQAAVRREAAGDRLRGGNNMLMILYKDEAIMAMMAGVAYFSNKRATGCVPSSLEEFID